MRVPAQQARRPRTVIQWNDDGGASRIPHFLSDDAPPYRALSFAAILGIVSILAVVAVIQFQRQGGFFNVGPLVEPANASATSGAEEPALTQTDVASAAVTQQAATTSRSARAPSPQPEQPAPAVTTSDVAVAAVPNSAEPAAARPQAAAAQGQAMEPAPLAVADPRWPDDQITVPMALLEQPKKGNDLLAFAPEATPVPAPRPAATPRQDATIVAAVEKAPKLADVRSSPGASAQVRSAVFLRARPADGAQVLVTVPRGAKVQIASNCRHWCSVTYQGKTGFIYKSFLSR